MNCTGLLTALGLISINVQSPVLPAWNACQFKLPPPPGWVVDKARFEPMETGELDVAGASAYRGAVEAGPAAAGNGVTAVNEVTLDDYLRGIAEVPAGDRGVMGGETTEMSASNPAAFTTATTS